MKQNNKLTLFGQQMLSTGHDEKLMKFYNNNHNFVKYKELLPMIAYLFSIRINKNSMTQDTTKNVILSLLTKYVENKLSDTIIYKKLWSFIHKKKYTNFKPLYINNKINVTREKNRYDEIMCLFKYANIDISKSLKELKLLDIGSGSGAFLYYIKNYSNLDMPLTLYYNDIRLPDEKYYANYYILQDLATSLTTKKITFNVITALMTLHHIKNFEEIIKPAIDRLDKGGYFIVRDHDANSDNIKICLDMIDKFYKFSLYDPPEVANFDISQDSISFFQSLEYFIEKITQMGLTLVIVKSVEECNEYYKEKNLPYTYNEASYMLFKKE